MAKKESIIGKPGILVFLGQAVIFESYEDAEKYAERALEDGSLKFATIVPNSQSGGTRTVLDSAIVVVNRGVVAGIAEDALAEGYLCEDPEEDED